MRLKTLQDSYGLGKITFAFYDDLSKQHYEKIIADYNLPNADVIGGFEFQPILTREHRNFIEAFMKEDD